MSLTTPEELRLVALGLEIGRSATLADACHVAVRQVGASLGVPCTIRSLKGSDWHTVARSEMSLDAAPAEGATRIALVLRVVLSRTAPPAGRTSGRGMRTSANASRARQPAAADPRRIGSFKPRSSESCETCWLRPACNHSSRI